VEELKAGWPEAGHDIDQLTGAFLEARYSARPIESERVRPIKRVWQRVSLLLRRPKKGVDHRARNDDSQAKGL
jgi:hypothetical protein